MNVLRLINEGTAIALSYGFYRKNELTDQPRYIAFVDFGHSKFTVTIASFIKGKLKIMASVSDRNCGARVMDAMILEKYGSEFFEKFGVDPRIVPKCRLRMFDAIEKVRKTLSGNKETNLNVECLLEDEDIHAHISREDFEVMIAPLMQTVA